MSLAQLPISFVEALAIGKQSRAGALGLLMYDYLITFDLEVDVVWRQSKRSPLCWLYLFNRFFPLVWLVLDLGSYMLHHVSVVGEFMSLLRSHLFPGGLRPPRCIIYLAIDDFVVVVSTLAVQVILQLRVYALYRKSRRVRLFLTFGCLAEVLVMAIFIGITLANIKGLPVISTNDGCYYTGIFSISAFFWLPALVYEPTLFLMVLWKAREEDWLDHFRGYGTGILNKGFRNPGKLVKVLARDSLIYFVGIFIELVINTVIWAHYNRYINVVVPWSGALPSILGSRLFLRMREAMLFPERYGGGLGAETSGFVSQSTVNFSPTRRSVSIWTRQAVDHDKLGVTSRGFLP
ncbi:hypothetical protein GSI_03469 [Ganoderma sinense ZZ0214-1]|uniref:DUF6533 domain-containing protein n=1 Tax=Ganoderma sinense ZZ0214-1 TaxID=1077348 RepID=A0A2G8SLQ8_9APHY|nr:hypothetical protein GSI_03469 [Ganoderma sinense ZZ0214-1]